MKRSRYTGTITVIQLSTIIKSAIFLFVLLLFIFSLSGLLTSIKPEYRISSESVNTAANHFPGQILFQILSRENHYFSQGMPKKESTSLTKQLFKLSTNISFDDPRSLLGRELPGFFAYDNTILVAGEGTDYTNMPYESAPPETINSTGKEAPVKNEDHLQEAQPPEPNPKPPLSTNGKKVVYIYHTHTRESYLPYLKGVTNPEMAYSSKINVTKLGERLKNDLEGKGIGTSADHTDVMGLLNKKGKLFPKAYDESRPLVEAAMASDRDLEYIIDIHRDSRRKKDTSITIKGKPYAKIAFVVGGKNVNYEKNFAVASRLHDLLEKKYYGLSRGVFKHEGSGQNGKYNQDLSSNALLIEVGGVDNTFEELYASIDAFAEVFSEIYWNAKEVNSEGSTPEAR